MNISIDYEAFYDNNGKIKGYIVTARIPFGINENAKPVIEAAMLDETNRFFAPSSATNVFSVTETDTARLVVLVNVNSALPTSRFSKSLDIEFEE